MATAASKGGSPRVVSHDEWIAVRKEFLKKEKEFSKLRDELSRERRELPWEKVEKQYVLKGRRERRRWRSFSTDETS